MKYDLISVRSNPHALQGLSPRRHLRRVEALCEREGREVLRDIIGRTARILHINIVSIGDHEPLHGTSTGGVPRRG